VLSEEGAKAGSHESELILKSRPADVDGVLEADEAYSTHAATPKTPGFLRSFCGEVGGFFREEKKRLRKELRGQGVLHRLLILMDFCFDLLFGLSIPQVDDETDSKASAVLAPFMVLGTVVQLKQRSLP